MATLIIFGTGAKHKVLGEGQFYCPQCGTSRPYQHKKAKRYFTLYFIPLIPMGDLGEYIECQYCHRTFSTQALKGAPPQQRPDLAHLLNSIGDRLSAGTPIEYLVRDLTAAGLDRDAALANVNRVVGQERKICPQCRLTYAPSVVTCSECHSPLQAHAQ